MKPEQYKDYSKVFDTFSHLHLCPRLQEFSDDLIELIKKVSQNGEKKIKIIDIGCGTGFFSKRIFDTCKNIELTLVEPSVYMLPILKKRFKNKDVKILEMGVTEALEKIPPQDIFIFQRSMYTFSGEEKFYHDLEKKIQKRLNPKGIIAIYDFSEKFDVDSMYEYIYQRKSCLNLNEDEFQNQWEIFKNSQIKINEEIEKGNFTLFSPQMRRKIFLEKNYHLLSEFYYYSFFQSKK